MKKSKIFTSLLCAIMAIPCGLMLSSCKGDKPNTYAANKKEVYAFSALSSAEYLTELSNNKSVRTFSQGRVATTRPELIKNDIPTINEYVGMFEGFLFNGGMKPTTSKPSVETDGETYGVYSIKMSMQIPNSDGTKTEYIMYYNEVDTETNTEVDDDGGVETETETTLDGVLLFGNEVFEVHGEKEIEVENNDTEVEIKFTTRSKTNRDNYIVVKQEMELDEVKFEYATYESGKLKSKNKVEWETENNEQKLNIQFINLSDNSYSKVKYQLEKLVADSKNIIKVKYKNGSAMESFTITDSGLTNIYNYSNGFTEEILKA